jgi:hypothetical protein
MDVEPPSETDPPPAIGDVPVTEREGFVRSPLVTRPVAVNDPVTVTPDIVGVVDRTTLPAVPVTGRFPRMPLLLYRISGFVPPLTTVVPTVTPDDTI